MAFARCLRYLQQGPTFWSTIGHGEEIYSPRQRQTVRKIRQGSEELGAACSFSGDIGVDVGF